MLNIETAGPGRTFTGVPGLYLHVTARGQKRWVLRFSRPHKHGVTEMSLGNASSANWPQVQVRVMQLRAQLAEGINPIEQRKAQISANVTFAEACELYIEHNRRDWSTSQIRSAKVLLHLHGEALLRVPAQFVDRDMVVRALKPLWEKYPKQVKKAAAMWRRVFDFVDHPNNPAVWRGKLEYKLPRPPREKLASTHYQAMDYQKVPLFLAVLRPSLRATGAVALEFCILTATRSGETLRATWDEFDLENRIWTIPAARMRKGRGQGEREPRPHMVPLCDRAMEILRRQLEYRIGANPYVFVGRKVHQPLAEKSMIPFVREHGTADTVHGFRASFKTWATEETTHDRWLIEMCLSHQIGSEVEQAYQRGQALERRRKIMEDWEAFCLSEPSLETLNG
jgi:integrase